MDNITRMAWQGPLSNLRCSWKVSEGSHQAEIVTECACHTDCIWYVSLSGWRSWIYLKSCSIWIKNPVIMLYKCLAHFLHVPMSVCSCRVRTALPKSRKELWDPDLKIRRRSGSSPQIQVAFLSSSHSAAAAGLLQVDPTATSLSWGCDPALPHAYTFCKNFISNPCFLDDCLGVNSLE